MKKYLVIISLFFSFAAVAQVDTVVFNTQWPNGLFGKPRTDTIYTLPRTTLKYFTGYGSFGSFIDTARSAFSGTTNRITITSGVIDIGTDVVTLTGSQTLTNKTLTSPVINVGSDATGDMYYRNASGLFTRLPVGSNTNVLTLAGGVPTWAAPSGGGSGGLADSAYFWSRTGNVAIFGDFLGTKNNLSFRIRAADTIRARIDSLTGSLYLSPRALNTIALLAPASTVVITTANAHSLLLGGVSSFNAASQYSMAFGQSTIGTGNGNIAMGYTANASGSGIALATGIGGAVSTGGIAIGSSSFSGTGVSLGNFADARTGNGIAIGSAATATGATGSIAIGNSTQATGISSTSVGPNSKANTNYSVAIGLRSTTTAANQFVAGGGQSGGVGGITDVYFGSGPSASMAVGDTAAGISYTIHGSGAGLGTTTSFNKAGGNLTLAGGKGTGSGTPGDLIFSTPTAGASSSTLQSLTQRWWVKAGTGQLSTTSTPDASLIVDITSTSAFFAPPRMTGAQASAVSSPANGSMVYITVTDATFTSVGFWGRENSVWIKL